MAISAVSQNTGASAALSLVTGSADKIAKLEQQKQDLLKSVTEEQNSKDDARVKAQQIQEYREQIAEIEAQIAALEKSSRAQTQTQQVTKKAADSNDNQRLDKSRLLDVFA